MANDDVVFMCLEANVLFSGPLSLDNLQKFSDVVYQKTGLGVRELRGTFTMRRRYSQLCCEQSRDLIAVDWAPFVKFVLWPVLSEDHLEAVV